MLIVLSFMNSFTLNFNKPFYSCSFYDDAINFFMPKLCCDWVEFLGERTAAKPSPRGIGFVNQKPKNPRCGDSGGESSCGWEDYLRITKLRTSRFDWSCHHYQ